MPGNADSKRKLLVLQEIFQRRTDEEHVLNATELLELLEKEGIRAERKSLYSDIALLRRQGMDIIKACAPRKGYFLGQRSFEMAELRLLADAVQAANFISRRKTVKLLRKIGGLSSEYQEKKLREQVYIDARPKCRNEEIYYSIDALDNAIKNGKQVHLSYARRVLTERYIPKREDRDFVLSPYALIWSNDHYYLVANHAKYDNLMHLRIDRIHGVEILDTQARPMQEVCEYKHTFQSADYVNKVFHMFSGKTEMVELCCNAGILEQILDRFGENVNLKRTGRDGFFKVRFSAAVNDGLVSYLMQYGDMLEVIFPASLRDMLYQKARRICETYGASSIPAQTEEREAHG